MLLNRATSVTFAATSRADHADLISADRLAC